MNDKKLMKRARIMVELYNTIMMTKLYPGHRGGLDDFDDLTMTGKDHFLRAARSCTKVNAKPREYLRAQFDAFARMSHGRRQMMFPQPNMIFGLKAQCRYIEWKATQDRIRKQDSDEATPEDKKFFREDRKLQAWSKRSRMPAADILVEHPAEFTKAFLIHKGVWDKVEEKWEEQMEDAV